MSVYIKGMEMPTSCFKCPLKRREDMNIVCPVAREMFSVADVNILYYRLDNCPIIPVPEHGRLIDADALIDDLKCQCKEVFRVNAVSPDDFWITRNEAYNERLWGTWCESFYRYLQTRPTIIPAEEEEQT